MAVAASDLITRAMKVLQALGSTEVPTAAEANDGLVAMNALLDSWTLEDLMTYEVQERSFTLVVGKNQYTIGASGADITTTPPQDIFQAYVQDSNGNNFPMKILPRDKWNLIGNRSTSITSQIPDTLFFDPQFPNAIINIFPTPLLTYTLFYDSVLNQVTFAALTTNLSMPPGYERAFVYNLAVEIHMMFGIPIPPVQPGQKNVVTIAAEALANVKRANIKEVISEYDGSIISKSYATYNIFRDSSN